MSGGRWEARREDFPLLPNNPTLTPTSITKKDIKVELPLFYTHVDDALAELEKAKENNDFPGMDINPYPLGGIFEMWAKDSA